jgi:hypothetical protein
MPSRSRVLAVLGLALALTGAASGWMSAPAAAAPATAPAVSPIDSVQVVSAGFTTGSAGEELSITVDSSTPLTSMTAHLYAYASSNTAATLNAPMQQASTGPQAGESTWTAPVGSLPLGTYNVTVDVTFQDETQMLGMPAGTVAFQDTPTITLNVNSVLSHDNQDPVISGTVTVQSPGATIGSAYADQPVTLVASGQPDATSDTDGTGGFTFSLTSPQPGETFYVEVPGSMTVAAAQTAAMSLTAQSDQVRMSASLSANTVRYGSKVTVKGTVTYAPGAGGFVALTGQTVRIYAGTASGSPVVTAVTDGKGDFTATLPNKATSVHWVLKASGPYLNTATATLPMKVNLPTVITGFSATLSQSWQVNYRGCVGLRAGVPGSIPSLTGLTIQYAERPGGPWHKLGVPVATQKSFVCGNDGRTFSGTLPAQLNYAYYRVVYAGATDKAGTGYLSSASGTVLAWKYEDRITSFAVSKRTVPKGGNLTVSGRLQYYLSGWRNYPGQPVMVIFRPQGSKSWYYIAIAATNSAGQFSATFIDPVTAVWSAEFLGNSTHLDTAAGTISVQVTQ